MSEPGAGWDARRRPRARRRLVPVLAALVVAAAVIIVRSSTGGAGGEPDPPQGPPGHWSFSWGDEFTDPSLDTSLWRPYRGTKDVGGDAPFNPDGEAAWFSSENVAVRDGMLTMSVTSAPKEIDGRIYPLRSGVVQSTSSNVIRPGTYAEARIEVPMCAGCWPAFWGAPLDRWPPEVDAFEYFDTATQDRPKFNYHAPDRSQTGPDQYGAAGTDYREGFHTYGVLWEGDRVVPYVDGKAYPEVAASSVADVPLRIILNLSVAQDGSPPDGSTMRVDWVRVWTR